MQRFYDERFGSRERQIQAAPAAQLGLAVVIPCHDEPDLLSSLTALWNCVRPSCAVEVIVIINAANNADAGVQERNLATFKAAASWAEAHHELNFVYHILHQAELPPKHAGVGLARKIGMDEAAARLRMAGRADAPIVCFDADSLCDANYLRELERHFLNNPGTDACSIYFEHPLSGPLKPEIYEAIAHYELHLRYYVEGLRLAGFPHAYHTIGSSMAVRAETYQKQGGMNKRQAGEDFYFLHKLIPLGNFTELNSTRVIPSPRASHRVPFGTGKAVGEYLENPKLETYPLDAFLDLGKICQLPEKAAGEGFHMDDSSLMDSVKTFLEPLRISEVIEEIKKNTSNSAAFQKRFFRWFDGFMAMKFVHHARDKYYGAREVYGEASRLARLTWPKSEPSSGVKELLGVYRMRQRGGAKQH